MFHRPSNRIVAVTAGIVAVTLAVVLVRGAGAQSSGAANEFNDSHFHLTNYIQQGI